MIKKILVLTLVSISFISSAQEKLTGFKNSLKSYYGEIKSVYPVVNEENNDLALFFVDAKNVYGYLFDDSFTLKDSLSSEDKSRKYKNVIGSMITKNNDYYFFLKNTKNDQFAYINFSFNNNVSTLKEFQLGSKAEYFVQSISSMNKFYLISVVKNTSLLGLYTFDEIGNYKRHALDFNDIDFINEKGKKTTLYDLIMEGKGITTNSDIKKIEDNFPSSIDVTSELRKLYSKDDTVLISFDENRTYTQVIEFNLSTFEKNFKKFEKPLPAIKSNQKKTNSFIAENYIYFLSAMDDMFTFTVNDYDTGSLLKKYTALEKDSITFKNSPIIQIGGMYDSYREMESTRKFIRKINAGEVGISSYKSGDLYQVSLGGKFEMKASGGGMMGGFPGIPIASFGSVSVFFNPAQFAYNSYANTRSTFIKCLFDNSFEHVEGVPKKNAFDKIKDFGDNDYIVESATSIFKYKDYFILGNLMSNSKEYVLLKFED